MTTAHSAGMIPAVADFFAAGNATLSVAGSASDVAGALLENSAGHKGSNPLRQAPASRMERLLEFFKGEKTDAPSVRNTD